MKRNRKPSFANPFMIWADLAVKTGEMMLASAQVIHHRTGRMAAAGPDPSARDRREFARMGQEKIEAAAESARAMATQAMTIDPRLGVRAASQMMTTAAALMSLAASRTAGQAMARQLALVRAMTQSAPTAVQMSVCAARIARRGLAPVHSRATANAKRLAKR
jgi:hypothetical protein